MAFDPKLGAEWGFTAEDLAANTAGRLTPEQEQGFTRTAEIQRRGSRRSAVILTVVFGLAGAFAVVAALTQPGGDAGITLVVVGAIFAWMLLIIAFFARRTRRMRTMFAEHRLHHAEGVLEMRPTMSEGTWWADFGDVRFEIDGLRSLVLTDGVRYRVNYIESGDQRLLVTLEPLEEGTS